MTDDLKKREAVWQKNEKELDKHHLNCKPSEIPGLLEKAYNHPVWEERAKTCFSCGSCINVCPTCYCFDVQDDVSWDLKMRPAMQVVGWLHARCVHAKWRAIMFSERTRPTDSAIGFIARANGCRQRSTARFWPVSDAADACTRACRISQIPLWCINGLLRI